MGTTPATLARPRESASRASAAGRCLAALGFIASFIGVGIGAASAAWGSPVLPFFEACCLIGLGIVVVLELRPAVIALRAARRSIRRFRRQLAALPETRHPLGA